MDILPNLNSPFIQKPIGFSFNDFEDKYMPTIILENAPNETLDTLISARNASAKSIFNETIKLKIIFGIAAAMAYIHSKGIIHRDLKPQNIYLDSFLMPKVGVFELSVRVDTELSLTKGVGTLKYMAPELINEEDYDQSVDVYAFAIVMHQILTGFLPKSTFTDIIKGIKPKIDEKVPKPYADLINRCLEIDPKKRPTFEEIVSLLKTDKSFITYGIDEEEYANFLNSIEKESKIIHTKDEKFKFEEIHIDYQENEELLINLDPIDLNLFQKLDLIGKGQYGKVFKVEEKTTGNIYAAKINILKLKCCENIHINNLSREITILSQLKYPSILRFIGYNPHNFKNEPKPTIITEYNKNKTLEEMIEFQIRGLSPAEWNDTKILITAYGIASGIAYLHSKGIIHRDLKPANIFFDDYLFPKIGDFGLSKEIDDKSTLSFESNHYIGTPVFMALEIFDSYTYWKAGDVYAFGILLYNMITLEKPFKNFSFIQLMLNVMSNVRPTFQSDTPNCYKKLIEKCWSKEAEQRPTFEEIVEILETDDEFITENVNESEYLNYIDYIKNCQINETFHPVTIDLEELIKAQKKDPTLNVSYLDLKQFTKLKLIQRIDNFKVYEVKNNETEEIFEAKVSNETVANLSDNDLIHLSREINILSKLNHPSFLKFIGYSPINFNQQPMPVIITEMPPNKTLQNLLDIERNEEHIEEWDENKKIIVIYGIAAGMAYLHSNNIIHRNLSPESVFLDKFLFPKIGNFGLLTNIHSTQSMTYKTSNGIKGNISYSAPELLQCNEYSKKTDVYAFALIVYEIVTLEKPFENINDFRILYNDVVNNLNRPKLNEDVDENYRKLIENCWAQNPEERPSFEDIMYIIKFDFVMKLINRESFIKYVSYIENTYISFHSKNKVVKFDDVIDDKKNHEEASCKKDKEKNKLKPSKSRKSDKLKSHTKETNINSNKNDDQEQVKIVTRNNTKHSDDDNHELKQTEKSKKKKFKIFSKLKKREKETDLTNDDDNNIDKKHTKKVSKKGSKLHPNSDDEEKCVDLDIRQTKNTKNESISEIPSSHSKIKETEGLNDEVSPELANKEKSNKGLKNSNPSNESQSDSNHIKKESKKIKFSIKPKQKKI